MNTLLTPVRGEKLWRLIHEAFVFASHDREAVLDEVRSGSSQFGDERYVLLPSCAAAPDFLAPLEAALHIEAPSGCSSGTGYARPFLLS